MKKFNEHDQRVLDEIRKERDGAILTDQNSSGGENETKTDIATTPEIKDPTEAELSERNEVAKEAPCYGSQILEKHEFASGECIYCGRHQPGAKVEKEMKQFGEE